VGFSSVVSTTTLFVISIERYGTRTAGDGDDDHEDEVGYRVTHVQVKRV
jgi:hypothetical protein